MADNAPDTIDFGIGQGYKRSMKRLANGSYADTYAPAYGAGLVTDSTGEHTFDIGSLPSKYKYDADRNPISATYGPNPSGLFLRQTTKWVDGLLDSESSWFLVDGLETP